jgi:hypothetical protein
VKEPYSVGDHSSRSGAPQQGRVTKDQTEWIEWLVATKTGQAEAVMVKALQVTV